jgi:dihydrofolate reductase
MRNVVMYELVSLDGVAETPNDFILHFDDVMEENLRQVISTQDTVLLGRNMFDEWSEFWPKSDIEPFASFINSVEKYVVTSTPLSRPWTNATVAEGSVAELVARLKSQTGGDIGVHGSVTLGRSMLEQGLVDELRLVIAPSVMVAGANMFEGTSPQRFEVISNVTSPTGYILVGLRAVRDQSIR